MQTGIGRTGTWFAFHQAGVVPDAITLAKGLGGGVPIGALVTFGPDVSTMLTAGQHGSTFGGNPLACAAGLAVLDTIEREGLLDHARDAGEHLERAHRRPRSPAGHRRPRRRPAAGHHAGRRPLRRRSQPWPATPGSSSTRWRRDAIRLAPPLVVTTDELDLFVDALPGLLDAATATPKDAP